MLQEAGRVRDGFLFHQEAKKQLWSKDRGVAKVNNREIAEEEVHGAVQPGACLDQRHQPEIAHEGEEINHEEDYKERNLQLWLTGQAEEDEVGHCGVVALSPVTVLHGSIPVGRRRNEVK